MMICSGLATQVEKKSMSILIGLSVCLIRNEMSNLVEVNNRIGRCMSNSTTFKTCYFSSPLAAMPRAKRETLVFKPQP